MVILDEASWDEIKEKILEVGITAEQKKDLHIDIIKKDVTESIIATVLANVVEFVETTFDIPEDDDEEELEDPNN